MERKIVKESNMNITVVTVCYNERPKIKKTVESVIHQTYSDIEYLIIDGGSTDGTLDIIKQYAKADGRIKIISEKDDGIYNAMNKAIAMAQGDYINFMNVGDSFVDSEVVKKVARELKGRKPDIWCGRAYIFEKGSKRGRISRKEGIYGKSLYEVAKGDWAYHQAVFAKADSIRQYYFNEKYKIAADYDWFVHNMRDKRKICFSDIIVCNYMRDGFSCKRKNRLILEREKDDIMIRHYGVLGMALRGVIKRLQ